ncbi:MAG: hypothetical protein CHACPFDD_02638 [Phycisphaerae bacterium]|nr:hypothetical protein [Phycisphaerae bacterium]
MKGDAPADVTQLLIALSDGAADAMEQLVPLVYDELRGLAQRVLRNERPDRTLGATALVNEAYLRLIDQKRVRWQHRAHFLAVAARLMRRILVDHARARRTAKRGGGQARVPLDDAVVVAEQQSGDLLALDEAMTRLAALDPPQARVVELRFFGGLTVEETAEVVGTSPATVKREWTLAKAWLRREVEQADTSGGTSQG